MGLKENQFTAFIGNFNLKAKKRQGRNTLRFIYHPQSLK